MIVRIDPEGREAGVEKNLVQTFRIHSNTTLNDVFHEACDLWDLKDRKSEFEFKYLDKENLMYSIKDMSDTVDSYFKKLSLRRIKIILKLIKQGNFQIFKFLKI